MSDDYSRSPEASVYNRLSRMRDSASRAERSVQGLQEKLNHDRQFLREARESMAPGVSSQPSRISVQASPVKQNPQLSTNSPAYALASGARHPLTTSFDQDSSPYMQTSHTNSHLHVVDPDAAHTQGRNLKLRQKGSSAKSSLSLLHRFLSPGGRRMGLSEKEYTRHSEEPADGSEPLPDDTQVFPVQHQAHVPTATKAKAPVELVVTFPSEDDDVTSTCAESVPERPALAPRRRAPNSTRAPDNTDGTCATESTRPRGHQTAHSLKSQYEADHISIDNKGLEWATPPRRKRSREHSVRSFTGLEELLSPRLDVSVSRDESPVLHRHRVRADQALKAVATLRAWGEREATTASREREKNVQMAAEGSELRARADNALAIAEKEKERAHQLQLENESLRSRLAHAADAVVRERQIHVTDGAASIEAEAARARGLAAEVGELREKLSKECAAARDARLRADTLQKELFDCRERLRQTEEQRESLRLSIEETKRESQSWKSRYENECVTLQNEVAKSSRLSLELERTRARFDDDMREHVLKVARAETDAHCWRERLERLQKEKSLVSSSPSQLPTQHASAHPLSPYSHKHPQNNFGPTSEHIPYRPDTFDPLPLTLHSPASGHKKMVDASVGTSSHRWYTRDVGVCTPRTVTRNKSTMAAPRRRTSTASVQAAVSSMPSEMDDAHRSVSMNILDVVSSGYGIGMYGERGADETPKRCCNCEEFQQRMDVVLNEVQGTVARAEKLEYDSENYQQEVDTLREALRLCEETVKEREETVERMERDNMQLRDRCTEEERKREGVKQELAALQQQITEDFECMSLMNSAEMRILPKGVDVCVGVCPADLSGAGAPGFVEKTEILRLLRELQTIRETFESVSDELKRTKDENEKLRLAMGPANLLKSVYTDGSAQTQPLAAPDKISLGNLSEITKEVRAIFSILEAADDTWRNDDVWQINGTCDIEEGLLISSSKVHIEETPALFLTRGIATRVRTLLAENTRLKQMLIFATKERVGRVIGADLSQLQQP
eukprot:Rmarinus@m.7399